MDWISTVSAVLGGIGIGTITCTYLQIKSDDKKYKISKKEEAYNGLLEALHTSQVDPNFSNASRIGHWHNRIVFVGSPNAINYSQILMDSEPNTPERKDALRNLFNAIRHDLKIDLRDMN